MIVLGAHYGHDGSACIVRDGRLVAALSHERLYRHKKAHGLSHDTLEAVLRAADVTVEQIGAVALSDWNATYAFGTIEVFKHGQPVPDTWNRVFDNEIWPFAATIRGRKIPAFNVGHHLCHCAAAYFTSPFQDAACFSMDSSGGWLKSNSVTAKGEGNRLTALECPGAMVGLAYGNVCERLGLGSQMFKAGSMMGLAAYGAPLERITANMVQHVQSSFFTEEMGYWKWLEDLWLDLAGQAAHFENVQHDSKEAMNIAATVQALFEASILDCVGRLPDSENICLGGGSFLNCNINSRIARESKFKNVHLFPAASDDGCAIGAALYVAHHLFDEPRPVYADQEIAYLGPERAEGQPDLPYIARRIADGAIVGWFQGRSECGPRALGHRSMLADPRVATNRERINSQIKNREWFRPLAPSVLAEDCAEWFDFAGQSPFMLMTAQVKQAGIPAVTHTDGSARMQTVTREMNPVYYDLIREFKALTGVPMLLNTSLNGPGLPLVETEEHALELWNESGLDTMIVGERIYER